MSTTYYKLYNIINYKYKFIGKGYLRFAMYKLFIYSLRSLLF